MDFPPLDDARWDRLLGAVVDQPPTVGDPTAPLATPFPAPAGLVPRARGEHHQHPQPGDRDDDVIRLDAYA